MASDFTPVGWGVMPAEQPGARSEDEEASLPSPGPAGAVVPPEVISAFLAHTGAGAAAALETVDESDGAGPLSSMNSGPLHQPLHNPFAVTSSSHGQQQHNQQPPPTAPVLTTQQHDHAGQRSSKPSRRSSQRGQKQPLVRRLVRGLVITAASAGLLAAGAWAGTAAYRHYMTQLDDRDQLARRVTELSKAEQRLLLRCTAVEQERSGLAERVAALGTTVTEEQAAAGKLRQCLQQVEADREEAVRHNLNLQRKLTNLEDSHAALTAAHKEQQAELITSRAEAVRLQREAGQLSSAVQKLEGRCAELEASASQLRSDRAALAAEAQQYKTQAHKLAVLSKS